MQIKAIIFASCLSLSLSQAVDIFRAIELNDKKVIQKWLKNECDTKVVDNRGQTIVIAAVHANNRSLVKQFLKKGVLINAIDNSGKTALDYAAELSRKKIVPVLLKKGAKVTSEKNLCKVSEIIKHRSRVFMGVGIASILCSVLPPLGLVNWIVPSGSLLPIGLGTLVPGVLWHNKASMMKDCSQKGYIL